MPQARKKKTSEGLSVPGIKLPVSFDQFAKNPVAAVGFCMLLAVGYLYVDQKSSYNDLIKGQGAKIESLESRVSVLTDQVRKSDSLLSAATSKLNTLQALGKIPQ